MRRATLLVLALTAANLILLAIARATGGPLPWTSWALPLVIMANAGAMRLAASGRAPRLARALTLASFCVALAIIASLISSNAHRFN